MDFNFNVNMDRRDVLRIYQPYELGVMSFESALTGKSLEELAKLCMEVDCDLEKSPAIEGVVRQESFTRYIGTYAGETGEINHPKYAVLKRIALEYTQRVYNKVAMVAGFTPSHLINSIGIHKYPAAGGGIELHRDYKKDKNLVGALSIAGEADFLLSKAREGAYVDKTRLKPGKLVLMRHPRNSQEYDMRPFHAVQGIGQDRYSIIFRERESEL